METRTLELPVIALRGLTVYPRMTVNFDVMRKKSIAAVRHAMAGSQEVFLTAQKDPEEAEPEFQDLYTIGTICYVRQVLKLPGGALRVTVAGRSRAELLELETGGDYYRGVVEKLELPEDDLTLMEKEGMLRVLKEEMEELSRMSPQNNADLIRSLLEIRVLEELLEAIASQCPWNYTDRQLLLECRSLSSLYETALKLLMTEAEVLKVKQEFQAKVKASLDKNQRDYVLREQMQVIREELGEDSPLTDADEMKEQLKKLKAKKEVKDKIAKEIARFQSMPAGSQDANVLRNYLETVLELPWDKVTKDNTDIQHAEEILEADHYGLDDVKRRILEYLAVRVLTKKGGSQILCLVGPPGTGKTSIAQSIARALGKKYVRISLGGVHDEAEIRGHRKTYVGAMPGRIVEGIRQAGTANPLMLLDEIDKASGDHRGDTASALLEVLDSEQNIHFRDHYIEIPMDLSQVFFIATANTTQTIARPLLDRMDVIEVSSYTENEKFHIGKNYLIPKQMGKNGLSADMLQITDSALRKIIHNYTREAGVRNVERRVGDICRKAAREILEKKKKPIRVNDKNLEKYLGREKYRFDEEDTPDQVGIVRGLAWTSVGGVTLEIEVNLMPGKGNMLLTGQMGEVMKESARIALTYVRSVAEQYGVDRDFFDNHDIHIHIPEGAVPKDGPSAGITMATAMLSAVSGRKVSGKTAMTGEVTLRGHVLPIGGLKEKLLAAKMAHMQKVLVPYKNKPDVEEISQEIRRGLSIIYVSEMDEVLREAFVPETEEKS